MKKVKPIAFYLPQYHTIPENDKWWGKGFTEWVKVKGAKSLFSGHEILKPHEDIGYYDLSKSATYLRQTELAKKHGIYGFCFYYYWFNGKKLLEKPLEMMFEGKSDFPFCICWANENWTKQWDGEEKNILMPQNHNSKDDRAFFKEILPILKDRRYIKIDGKPLLIIYRTELFPNIKNTAKLWRELAKKAGLKGLYLLRVESFKDNLDPKEVGFDGAIEFAPSGVWGMVGESINKHQSLYGEAFPDKSLYSSKKGPRVYDYDTVAFNLAFRNLPSYNLYRCAFPCWDNTPRKSERGIVFWNAKPLKFSLLLKKQVESAVKNNQEYIFINAWNEWGEGCALEPNDRDAYANLEAVKNALDNQKLSESEVSYLEKRLQFLKRAVEIISDKELKSRIDRGIQARDREIEGYKKTVKEREQEIAAMKFSKFWKLRGVYLRIISVPRRAKWAYVFIQREGLELFLRKIWYRIYFRGNAPQNFAEYSQWRRKNEKIDVARIKEKTNNFKYKPKISVIVPVYNVDPKWLKKCVESVRNQYYKNWELCMHDDASTNKATVKQLKKYQAEKNPKIKISFGHKNQHISGASNDALKMATGEFIALLDNEDTLAPNALYENVRMLNQNPKLDLIYSDEDKIDLRDRRMDPYFKPDWSPDLLLSQMYISHLSLYRKSIIDKIGGFRIGYQGAQDHDLVLRFIEQTKGEKVYHIPKVLYHWRPVETSTASLGAAKSYTFKASKKALEDYLERNDIKGKVLKGTLFGYFRVKREIEGNPLVSIIIPFRDQAEVLEKCVDSILSRTEYQNYEILLVNNQSKEATTKDYLSRISAEEKIRIIDYDKTFNFSAINNFAVKKAEGEFVLLLNNDMEVISTEWLSAMLEQAERKEVGAVGAKLLYPNNTVQHAGIVMGLGIAGHAFKYFQDGLPGNFSHADILKNYSAVTGACLMTRKELYEKIGGLNERELGVAYNDVDFCLRLRDAGYLVVYTPYAKLYHHESLSRGYDSEFEKTNPKEFKRVVAERDYMEKKWKKYIDNDPYYNPNLTRRHEDFSPNTD